MNTPAFTVVRTTRTAVEADMLISVLRTAGFHPVELNTSGHYSIGGADCWFRIQVPTSELSEARAVLSSYEGSSQMD